MQTDIKCPNCGESWDVGYVEELNMTAHFYIDEVRGDRVKVALDSYEEDTAVVTDRYFWCANCQEDFLLPNMHVFTGLRRGGYE